MNIAHTTLNPFRRTKIVATLGPASDTEKEVNRLLIAGVNVVRLNFSHGTKASHQKSVQQLRKCAAQLKLPIGIMADLQGPKIRIACFKEGQITLASGDIFILDPKLPSDAGDQSKVGLDYPDLPKDVNTGDELWLDDGRITLRVESVKNLKIYCRVVIGGILSNHKGINKKGGGLSANALTPKDYEDIKTAVALQCDYIAVSFPRSSDDLHQARAAIKNEGGTADLIAKIERADALPHLDEIINASKGVMVARGDLGVEIGEAEVPAVQKHIIQRARALNKIVITATQMMESMVHSAIPSRAEVSDVANAVLDGTDAVMLSAETATGDHPAHVVEVMSRICQGAEKHKATRISDHRIASTFEAREEAIAMAAMYIGNHLPIKGIIAFTETGATPLWMSRIRSGIPIYSFTASLQTQYKMTLYRGVYPFYLDFHSPNTERIQNIAMEKLKSEGYVQAGDCMLATYGRIGTPGGTNTLKLLTVP